jgi:hypothetical protein
MFKRLATFRLFQSWRLAPGLQEATPANDNPANILRPRGQRRIRSQALACRWSRIDGGTRLGCRWQSEALAQATLEDSDSELVNNQTFQSQAIRLGRRRNVQNSVLTVGA